MRLLLVSAAHHPDHGGIGTAVSTFVRRATDAGWHIELLTRSGDNLPHCANVHLVRTIDETAEFRSWIDPLRKIHRIRPYRYGLWSLAVAKKLLELHGTFDAIEFVDSQAEGFVALHSERVRERWGGVPLCIRTHTPMWLIERLNGADLTKFGRHLYHQWERQALAAAHGVTAPSQLLLDALQPAQTYDVVPPMLPDIAAISNRAGRSIVFVGNLEPNKGIDFWIQSLNHVLKRHGEAMATIVGADTPAAPDGTSMRAYSQSLLDPAVEKKVTFAGRLPAEGVQQVLYAASMVVVPSRFESFSYVACEAILRGIPVVVTCDVGINEYTHELVKVGYGDIEALTKAQCDCLDDPAAALTRITRAREQLVAACKPSLVLSKHQQFLDKIDHTRRKPESGLDAIDQMDCFLRETLALAAAGRTSDRPLVSLSQG